LPTKPDGEVEYRMRQEEKKALLDVTSQEWKAELTRERYRNSFVRSLRGTIFALITVAAAAVLVAVLLLPVLRIYGTSMSPTLEEGNYVLSVKGSDFKTGDVVAFYYNNKVLVKRVIAVAGEWVNMDEDGTVYVNDVKLDEPYVTDLAIGQCDIELPYQVPDSRIFVMGDHRSVSVDSRSSTIGCIADEQIVGRIVFRLWPFGGFGAIH